MEYNQHCYTGQTLLINSGFSILLHICGNIDFVMHFVNCCFRYPGLDPHSRRDGMSEIDNTHLRIQPQHYLSQ